MRSSGEFFVLLLLLMMQFPSSFACDVDITNKRGDMDSILTEIIDCVNNGDNQITISATDNTELNLNGATQDQIDNMGCNNQIPSKLTLKVNLVMFKNHDVEKFNCEVEMTDGKSLTYQRNSLLKSIGVTKADLPDKVKVWGNPQLTAAAIGQIQIDTSTYPDAVQAEGECTFLKLDGKYSSPKTHELNGCKNIRGDFIYDGSHHPGDDQTDIKKITGCLVIRNSGVDNLNFLKNLAANDVKEQCVTDPSQKSEISGNPNLYIHPKDKTSGWLSLPLPANIKMPRFIKEPECTAAEALSGDYDCFVVTEDLTLTDPSLLSDFNKANIKEIRGQLVVDNTAFTAIEFPKLETVGDPNSNFAIQITGNQKLQSIDFPALTTLTCTSNTAVQIASNKIFNIPQATEQKLIAAAGTKEVDIGFDCTTAIFNTNRFCATWDGDLEIKDRTSTSVPSELDYLRQIKYIKGNLKITGNKQITLDFPNLRIVGNAAGPGVTPAEKGITFATNKEVTVNMPLIVRYGFISIGSKDDLVEESVKKLFQLGRGYKFNYECSFNGPIDKADKLNYCTAIKGNLYIENMQDTAIASARITKITGCLRIVNTKLRTLGAFHLSAKSTATDCTSIVTGNEDLCMEKWLIKQFQNEFGQEITFEIDGKCDLPCDETEFQENDNLCRTFEGDIDVSKPAHAPVISKVERLIGNIEIVNTQKTSITFPKLKKIKNPLQRYNRGQPFPTKIPTIHIENNNQLTKLEMPVLQEFTQEQAGMIVNVRNNEGFRLPKELLDQLPTNPQFIVEYACHETGKITNLDSLSGCRSMSSGLELDPSVTGSLPQGQIEGIEGCLKIEGTGLESIAFLETSGPPIPCLAGHSIKNNAKLCISDKKKQKLEGRYQGIIIGSNKKKQECPETCDANTIVKTCEVVESGVTFTSCNPDDRYEKVKEVQGTITVDAACSLNKLTVLLPNLKKIVPQTTALVLKKITRIFDFDELKTKPIKFDTKLGELNIDADLNDEILFMTAADIRAHHGKGKVNLVKEEPSPPEGPETVVPPTQQTCKKIEGDLILDQTAVSVVDTIETITGCLSMKNTNMQNYDFLTKLKSVGTNCRWPNLSGPTTSITLNSCIPYSIRKNLSEPLFTAAKNGINAQGCKECNGLEPGKQCEVIIGDLVLTGAVTAQQENQLKGIRQIFGDLKFKDTTLTSISLTKLKKIHGSSNGKPALEVSGNKNLKTFEFHLLVGPLESVHFENNPKLQNTDVLKNKLKVLTGQECKENGSSKCTFSSQTIAKKGGKSDSNDEAGLCNGVIAGIVVGVLAFVLIIAGLVIFFVMRKRKRNNKSPKDKAAKTGKAGKGKKEAETKTLLEHSDKTANTPTGNTPKNKDTKENKEATDAYDVAEKDGAPKVDKKASAEAPQQPNPSPEPPKEPTLPPAGNEIPAVNV